MREASEVPSNASQQPPSDEVPHLWYEQMNKASTLCVHEFTHKLDKPSIVAAV
jgi:hypothetical protein